MSELNVQKFRLNLTAAGSEVYIAQVGFVHLMEFQDGNGDPVLDGLIEYAVGEGASQYFPLRYNGKFALPEGQLSRVAFRWSAQADTYAVLLFSPSPRKFTSDSPPTRQLVTTAIGGTVTTAEVTCDNSADALVAADSTRFVLMLRNIGGVDCYIGPSGVTPADGMLLAAGETFIDDKTTAAYYGITAAGTATLRRLVGTL